MDSETISHRVCHYRVHALLVALSPSLLRYMSVFPAFLKSASDGYSAGTCVTTKINRLLSCSGQHQGYLRLCPCRHYRKGQVALPVEI